MNEKDAVKKFYECANMDDIAGALDALRFISTATINHRDMDDYDMLISAVQNEQACAVEALLIDGRCDLTHEENLCGNRAYDFAQYCPEDSMIRQYFQKYYNPAFIFEDGKVILQGEIFRLALDGQVNINRGRYEMLDEKSRADLLAAGIITPEEVKDWNKPAVHIQ